MTDQSLDDLATYGHDPATDGDRSAAPGQVQRAVLHFFDAALEADLSAGAKRPAFIGRRTSAECIQHVLDSGIPTNPRSVLNVIGRYVNHDRKLERFGAKGSYTYRRIQQRGVRLVEPPPAPVVLAPEDDPEPPITDDRIRALIEGWTKFGQLVGGTRDALAESLGAREASETLRKANEDLLAELQLYREECDRLTVENQQIGPLRAEKEQLSRLLDESTASLRARQREVRKLADEVERLRPVAAKAESIGKVLRRLNAAARDMGVEVLDLSLSEE